MSWHTWKRPSVLPATEPRCLRCCRTPPEPRRFAAPPVCSLSIRPISLYAYPEALKAVSDNAHRGYRWVVDADIEQFFDTLDHQQLMAALRRRISDGELLRLLYRWLKAGYLVDGEYHATDQGSPQGGVLSPLLANVYLLAFD